MEPTQEPRPPAALEAVIPDPSCEREVPYFVEEFTLSGGCCGDGLKPLEDPA